MTSARGLTTVRHPVGLHARPAVKLTRLAKTFPEEILLRGHPDGDWVDAKSIVKVMSLKLQTGSELEFWVRGGRAESVLAVLTALVERDFDETG